MFCAVRYPQTALFRVTAIESHGVNGHLHGSPWEIKHGLLVLGVDVQIWRSMHGGKPHLNWDEAAGREKPIGHA